MNNSILRYAIPLITFLLPTVFVNGQSIKCEDGRFHWEGGFNAGLNNDGYEFDLRALYFPIGKYIGAKVGLGFAGEIEELGDWGKDEFETGHKYAIRFKFNPAVVIRTPRLINWESQGAGIYLFTEPGVVLSPGANGSRNAKYFRWDVKSGLNLQLDRYIITLGYGISDFSLYSGAPVSHNGPVSPNGVPKNTNYITHTVFLGGAYKF